MANIETDRLGLVQISTVTKSGWFSRPTVTAAEDFCLVVFRGDTYRGTLYSNRARNGGVNSLDAKSGDTVMRINLGPQRVSVNGTVETRDGFKRAFRSLIDLRVTDSSAFARLYRQGSDPVDMATHLLRGAYQGYANLKNHDDMNRAQMPFHLKPALAPDTRTGLSVDSVYALSLDLDPHKEQLQGIARDTKVKVAQKDQQATLNALDREEDDRRFEHERGRTQITDADARQKAFLDNVAAGISASLRTRIQEDLLNGMPLDQVLSQYPQLADVFLPSGGAITGKTRNVLREAPHEALLDRPFNSGAAERVDYRPGEVQTGIFTEVPEPAISQSIDNPDLGLELTRKALKPEECQRAKLPPQSYAFQVTDIDVYGPAAKVGIQGLDYLLQINEKPLQDAHSITSLLYAGAPGAPIKLLVLRKGVPEPMTLAVTLG